MVTDLSLVGNVEQWRSNTNIDRASFPLKIHLLQHARTLVEWAPQHGHKAITNYKRFIQVATRLLKP